MPARFIVLEGIDQSGKKTQSSLLVRRLEREGFRATALTFPVYASPSGRIIRGFLLGRRKLPSEAVHMLYSLNRWENKESMIGQLESSEFVVADRYTPSNIAYGMARGLDLEWLRSLDRGLPIPDTVIVLDVPVPSSFDRKASRRDLHESDRVLLSRVRGSYLKLARALHWNIVKGTGPAEKVHEEVWTTVKTSLLDRSKKPRKEP